MRRRTLLLAVILLAAGACTESDLTITIDRPADRTVEGGPAPDAEDADAVATLALQDLEAYWADAMLEVYGTRFEPLRGGYLPYGPGTPLPSCGQQALDYELVAENALYCPFEDYIAWDRTTLLPDLQARFGPLTVGMVMAHEFAHAVQNRADTEGAAVTLELQADCFAGAWVADVDDRLDTFSTGGDALDEAVAGLLELRDTLGVPGYAPVAHGSGFDRVSAFQDGYEGGPQVCAAFEQEPPTVVAIPFGSLDDEISGGNLPLEELVDPLVLDLESFFDEVFAGAGQDWEPVRGIELFDPADGPIRCGDDEVAGDELVDAAFHCAADGTHYLDGANLVPALEEIGDFAFGGEVARLHAFAAQDQLGLGTGDPEAEGLHADCFAGAYAGAEFAGAVPDQQLQLSPGDLDEVIIAFLAFGGEGEATAFERTAAFRDGFLAGVTACPAYLR
ncbi:MAG: neutral zinc metallopeptidase [Acidimicrobiia bacterium]